jgi:hypothetical protein
MLCGGPLYESGRQSSVRLLSGRRVTRICAGCGHAEDYAVAPTFDLDRGAPAHRTLGTPRRRMAGRAGRRGSHRFLRRAIQQQPAALRVQADFPGGLRYRLACPARAEEHQGAAVLHAEGESGQRPEVRPGTRASTALRILLRDRRTAGCRPGRPGAAGGCYLLRLPCRALPMHLSRTFRVPSMHFSLTCRAPGADPPTRRGRRRRPQGQSGTRPGRRVVAVPAACWRVPHVTRRWAWQPPCCRGRRRRAGRVRGRRG